MDSVHEGPHAGWTRPPQSQLTHRHVRLQAADVGQDIPGTGAVRTGELAPRQRTLTGNDETWILDLDRTKEVLGLGRNQQSPGLERNQQSPGLGQDQQNPGTWTGPTESWDLNGTNRILGLGQSQQNPGLGRDQQNDVFHPTLRTGPGFGIHLAQLKIILQPGMNQASLLLPGRPIMDFEVSLDFFLLVFNSQLGSRCVCGGKRSDDVC